MKRYIYPGIAAIILLSYLHIFYFKQLQVIAWIVLTLLGISIVLIFIFSGWYASERLKMLRAARIDLEKQAHVLQLHNQDKTWIRDTDHNAYWHALHLEQRVYSNSEYVEPSDTERQTWREYHRPTKAIENESYPLLESPQITLNEGLSQSKRCLIVGATHSGKTTVLQHLAELKKTEQVIVIDPHAYPDKWPQHCEVKGLGRKYPEIDDTLNGLVQLMTNRYEDIAKGNLSHPPLTIIIDEWRSITHNLKDSSNAIRTLLTESRKANFSIYVASHSDRAKPLGLQGEYDLKEGFTVIRLQFENNQHRATVDTEHGKQSIELPGAFLSGSQAISNELIELPKPIPNELETRVIDLYRQGMKPTPIAMEVFGSKGGNQVDKVREIIERWNQKE